MKKRKTEYLKNQVISMLSKDMNKKKTSKEICYTLGISFRELKEIITELRIQIPICSMETNGGGYWIGSSNREINDFVSMIEARKNGYEKTINVMQNHLTPEVYPTELFSTVKD